jgi:hypothetical protein
VLLWSIAEGARGARWRASGRGPNGLLWDMLLEVGLDGRPGRLEMTMPSGQLTLHPEPDGLSARGNVVTVDGVRPLAFPWSPRHWFESRQGPVTSAAMLRSLRSEVAVGEFRLVPGLHVDDELGVSRGERGVQRLTESRWSIKESDGFRRELSLDADGLPIFEAGDERNAASEAARVWPLEVVEPAE